MTLFVLIFACTNFREFGENNFLTNALKSIRAKITMNKEYSQNFYKMQNKVQYKK